MNKQWWQIVPGQSLIRFKTSLLRIGTITGSFSQFQGTLRSAEGFAFPEIAVRIAVRSVETYDEHINDFIRSAHFLDPKVHPWIAFSSTGGCAPAGANIRELPGMLMVKAREMPVTFLVGLGKLTKINTGLFADFSLSGQTRLSDFGLYCFDEIGDQLRLEALIRLQRSH
jgi:polyisoprenoid-binding protein YceI